MSGLVKLNEARLFLAVLVLGAAINGFFSTVIKLCLRILLRLSSHQLWVSKVLRTLANNKGLRRQSWSGPET